MSIEALLELHNYLIVFCCHITKIQNLQQDVRRIINNR